jgi:outer membrane protein TolC
VEVDRVKQIVADLEQQATSAREDWRVASADLTQILRLDPRAVVVPVEHDHLQVTLVDANRPLDDLIPIALTTRPELASQQALVREVLVRVRQEKLRPFIPTFYLNGFQTPNEMIQGGYFQTGHGNSLNLGGWRNDVTLQLMWQADNLGLGNAAKVQQQRSRQSRQLVEFFKTQDMVAADVTRAQARVQSAADRVKQAERELKAAVINYDGNYEGLAQTTRFENLLIEVFRPQEAVAALRDLKTAYDKYFTTVAEYNRAQFDLYHALGYPAAEVLNLPSIGPEQPIDTSRPGYLPPVGDGPPPVAP